MQRTALHTTAEKGKPSSRGVEREDKVGGREGIEKDVKMQRRAGFE